MKFQETILSNYGFVLAAGAMAAEKQSSLILQDVNQIWNLKQFQTIRQPVLVGTFDNWRPYPRVLDLPIKFPGSEYRIPAQVSGLEDLIQTVINYEHWLNPLECQEFYPYANW